MLKQDNIIPINAFYITALRDKRSKDRSPVRWVNKKTGAIHQKTGMDSIDLVIYIMLLSRADKDKLICYPSIETICADCGGLDRRVVWQHIQILEQMQYIDVIRNRGRPNKYYMRDFEEWAKDPHY